MGGKLTILGCGGSAGVPAIGNWWGDCDPAEPRNVRTRPSIALQTENTLVIVDTGPDFRQQVNREQLGVPDAVIITHVHFDHINGLDELRILQRRAQKPIFPLHALGSTLKQLHVQMGYMFTSTEDGLYPAVCEPMTIDISKPFTIGDIRITPFEQEHGSITSLGIRVGNIAYSTDMRRLDKAAMDVLRGVDTWIVDGGGFNGVVNVVHASSNDVLEMNREIGAKKIYLTHLPPKMDYQTLRRELPAPMEPAHDGLVIAWEDNG